MKTRNYATLFRKFFLLIAASYLFVGMAANANAMLLGQQVTGEINFGSGTTNFFDPANGFVPAGFLNVAGPTVTIGEPAQEFGFDDTFNRDIANFTGNGLIVTDNVQGNVLNWTMTFTSAGFVGLILAELSDNFDNGGVVATLISDTLTLAWDGTSTSGGLRTAEYSLLDVQVVPLPAALPLFGSGLAIMGLIGWRRKRKAAV